MCADAEEISRRLLAGCGGMRWNAVGLEARKGGSIPIACKGDVSHGLGQRPNLALTKEVCAGFVSVCVATSRRKPEGARLSACDRLPQHSRTKGPSEDLVTRGPPRAPGTALITVAEAFSPTFFLG